VALCLAVGALGGVSGALLVADRGTDEPPRTVVATPTPTPPAVERLRDAIGATLEAVVTILVDLPSREGDDGRIIDSSNFGSGIVLRDGMVLTNQHVIEGAVRIRVILPTGEEREATVVADDAPFQDVAIIRTDPRGLRQARLGSSSNVVIGDPVAVIASGVVTYQNQAKSGIISARDLQFPREGVILDGMFQTDTPVNSGDSGSALINADGEVIGLVTSVVRTIGTSQVQGVSMAHAIDDLRPFIDAVLGTSLNPRGRIGIERVDRHHLPLTPGVASELGLPFSDGAVVLAVEPGSPAAEAGFEIGDVVVAVQGQAVHSEAPFPNLLGGVPAGAEVRLTVWRAGQSYEVTLLPRAVGVTQRSAQ